MKITITKNVIQHGSIYAKKGDVIDVSPELAAEWIKAKYAEAVTAKKESK